LGGNPPNPEDAKIVCDFGGLHVLGTERHESRRIDNQLRGRAGRQGDPGTTQFYVSLEDDLMRIFGSDSMKKRMEMLRIPEDEPIESKMLTRAIASAQKKVEGHHFDIRKHLLEYDDVINKHRVAIYGQRRQILEDAVKPTTEGERPLKVRILQAVEGEIEQIVSFHTSSEDPALWDVEEIAKAMGALLPADVDATSKLMQIEVSFHGKMDMAKKRTEIIDLGIKLANEAYVLIENSIGDKAFMAEVEKSILLRAFDDLWIEHLDNIDHLRRGIGLQGYAQHDPLVEYKREAYRMFNELNALINKAVAHAVFKIQIARQAAVRQFQLTTGNQPLVFQGAAKTSNELNPEARSSKLEARDPKYKNIGRNDLCPCGSGLKFKKCHGK
jgi:preprotein translocase subunit SecA